MTIPSVSGKIPFAYTAAISAASVMARPELDNGITEVAKAVDVTISMEAREMYEQLNRADVK